jgi:hypothetical protein
MKLFLTALSMVILTSSLLCQDVPNAEVFGGYSYLNVDTNDLSSRQNANGWVGIVSGNFTRWFGVEFDGGGYYKSIDSILGRDYSYLAGPRFVYGPIFAHALLGGDHLSGGSATGSQDSLAGAFGGGIEFPVSKMLAFRTGGDYVFTRHNITGGPSVTQNNFRAVAGIVFRFGRMGTSREAMWQQSTVTTEQTGSHKLERAHSKVTPEQAPNTSEAALLGVVGFPTEDGYKVTSVRLGSPAERSSFKPGDIITAIDGKSVHTATEIESAIAASTSGTVTISGFTHNIGVGQVLFKREVNIR